MRRRLRQQLGSNLQVQKYARMKRNARYLSQIANRYICYRTLPLTLSFCGLHESAYILFPLVSLRSGNSDQKENGDREQRCKAEEKKCLSY